MRNINLNPKFMDYIHLWPPIKVWNMMYLDTRVRVFGPEALQMGSDVMVTELLMRSTTSVRKKRNPTICTI